MQNLEELSVRTGQASFGAFRHPPRSHTPRVSKATGCPPEAVPDRDDLHLAVRGRDVDLLAGRDGGRRGRGRLDHHHVLVQGTWAQRFARLTLAAKPITRADTLFRGRGWKPPPQPHNL